MINIAIISASVRTGRRSHRVALYFQQYLKEKNLATSEILDLNEYQFPIFHERIWNLKDPPAGLLDFSEKIKAADGVIIVTPEYNGGYPASIKNAVDVLYEEWHRKPISIACVSDGDFGGTQVIVSLQWSLWKMRAWTVPARFHVQRAQDSYDKHGIPADKTTTDKRASTFIGELLWCIEAKRRMAE